jgi:hypothetical protein
MSRRRPSLAEQCRVYWGTHGCKKRRGHPGPHRCTHGCTFPETIPNVLYYGEDYKEESNVCSG